MKISVAMCTYNGSRFLDEQLSSISSQSRLPDELIVCDDCSPDDTVKRLQDFAQRVSFPVRVIVNENNLGSTRNFDKAISLCKGDVVALSDQDDIWNLGRLQRMEEVFGQDSSAVLVFSNADVIGPDSSPVGLRLWQNTHFGFLQQLQLRRKNAAQALLSHNLVTGATTAFRSGLRDVALPIPEFWTHDGWVALIAAFFGEIVALNESLVQYRRHPNQQIGPADRNLSSRIARARGIGSLYYGQQAKLYQAAHERLLPHVRTAKQEKIMKCIAAKIQHLLARADMPQRKMARIPFVLRELTTMRYTLYSRGMISALRDLLA